MAHGEGEDGTHHKKDTSPRWSFDIISSLIYKMTQKPGIIKDHP